MEQPTYYAVLTADVRYDKNLSSLEKLLFAEITALSNKEGFCWASNKYFAELYNKHETWISQVITKLRKKGYISVYVSAIDGNKRHIYIGGGYT